MPHRRSVAPHLLQRHQDLALLAGLGRLRARAAGVVRLMRVPRVPPPHRGRQCRARLGGNGARAQTETRPALARRDGHDRDVADNRASVTSMSTSMGSSASAALWAAGSSTVSPSRPQASSKAAEAVEASATARHAGHALWRVSPRSWGVPNKADSPPTSSRTKGPHHLEARRERLRDVDQSVDGVPKTHAAPQTRSPRACGEGRRLRDSADGQR